MNGKIRIFFNMLLIRFIWLCRSFSAVDFFYDQANCSKDSFVVKKIFGRIHEQDIHAVLVVEHVLLLSPGFAYPSLTEIALDGSLEDLLWYRNKNPGLLTSCVFSDKIAHARYISMSSLGKQLFNKRLAAESFCLF